MFGIGSTLVCIIRSCMRASLLHDRQIMEMASYHDLLKEKITGEATSGDAQALTVKYRFGRRGPRYNCCRLYRYKGTVDISRKQKLHQVKGNVQIKRRIRPSRESDMVTAAQIVPLWDC